MRHSPRPPLFSAFGLRPTAAPGHGSGLTADTEFRGRGLQLSAFFSVLRSRLQCLVQGGTRSVRQAVPLNDDWTANGEGSMRTGDILAEV